MENAGYLGSVPACIEDLCTRAERAEPRAKALADALTEILEYSGGADSALEEARRELFVYIQGDDNRLPIHYALGYSTPELAERKAS